jgi:hypothetical protein
MKCEALLFNRERGYKYLDEEESISTE